MSNISVGQNHFQIPGADNISGLTVYKVPAASADQDGELIISISGAGNTGTVTISDACAIELVARLTGLICTSETERLRSMNNGQELVPLSPPLQNLLRHIQNSASEKIKENK